MKMLKLMLGLLTTPYTKKDEYNAAKSLPLETNLGKLLGTFGWGLDMVESTAERVRLWANIDNARGATLDRYGANFGVSRGGADDVFYRLMIKIKMLSQLSGGDIETIISAVSGLYEIDPASVELYEHFPAKIQVVILEEALPEGYENIRELVWAMTKRLLAAGVGLIIAYKVEAYTNGTLYLGGRVVTEYTMVRPGGYEREIPALEGRSYLGGRVTTEFTRIRLKSQVI